MKCNRYSVVGRFRSLVIVVFLGSIQLFGCRSEPSYPYSHASETKAATPIRLALVPGDVVEVKFFYTPNLDESQTVRPDGKIQLQLIGEVGVEGKTPGELRNELLELYTPHLKAPQIAVVVRSFQERRVFVGGQVLTPGIIEMPGEMDALEAVMQAGGFDLREAEVRNVVIIRHRNGQRYGYSINLKPALMGDETQPFYLEPNDIIYVPRTKIAKLNQWIDQHINKIIPDTGLFFMRRSGNTTVGVGTYR
jgi:polysaccharide export outer membrane protein